MKVICFMVVDGVFVVVLVRNYFIWFNLGSFDVVYSVLYKMSVSGFVCYLLLYRFLILKFVVFIMFFLYILVLGFL